MENDYAIALNSNNDHAIGARYNGTGHGKVKSSWGGHYQRTSVGLR